jgi:hypothetical protein
VLAEEARRDTAGIRVQVEWCRTVCRESADVFDERLGGQDSAKACRECAQACTDFLATLSRA